MSFPGGPVEVFCSYAPEDEIFRHQLETHLSLLQREGLLSLWHPRKIAPGTDWSKAIDEHLSNAAIILLLISSDFLASDYCYGVEMALALQLHEANKARVLPIIARSVLWQSSPFSHLSVLPTNARAIARWRDRDDALTDVANGIRQAINNLQAHSEKVAGSERTRIWNIPLPRNRFFLGRDNLLADLTSQLRPNKSLAVSQPQAISGLGGVGKTQLAIEYAYRSVQQYQAVLWSRAGSREVLTSGFVELARILDLPERDEQDQKIVIAAVKQWLCTHDGWLLILDNADEPALVFDFLPHLFSGHIILTTRAQAISQMANRLEIDVLEEETAMLLLLRRAGVLAPNAPLEQADEANYVLAQRLCKELGALPLALDQAGAYIEETLCGLQQYLDLFQKHRAELLRQRGGLVSDHEPVATTWSLSFHVLEQKSTAAADVLRLCAFLHPDAIPEELFLHPTDTLTTHPEPHFLRNDPLTLNRILSILSSYSFVRRNSREHTITTHRMVQVSLQDAMTEQEYDVWIQRAIEALNTAFPDITHTTWKQCERLLSHALICVEQITVQTSLELASLSYTLAYYLYQRARYKEAEPLYRQALRIREHPSGEACLETVPPLYGLANLYKEQGKYTEAEPLYLQALQILQQTQGPEHSDVAPPLIDLANLYREQGKYAAAEPLYLQALRIREQTLGPEHPQMASPLTNLANLYKVQGKYAAAEVLYQRALRIREHVLGPDHPAVAYPLTSLANFYRVQGKYLEAEPLYLRALHIREHTLGPVHPDVAYPLHGLANLYKVQGKYAAAEPLYLRALYIWEQALGSEHPEVAYPLYNVANLYRAQEQYIAAEPLYLRALYIWEQALGPEHPQVAYALNGLADLYRVQEQYTDVEPLYLRAFSIWEQALGSEHPQVACALNGLADLYRVQGKHAAAEPLYLRALHIREQALGSEHPEVAYPLSGLADLYRDQGKYAAAEPLYLRALHIREQALGSEHPEVAYPLNGLADLYTIQGRSNEAEPLYLRALRIRKRNHLPLAPGDERES
jgi:tetratricopeptide (TPR) repeat protein